jgi:hypothetical protein
MDAGEGFLGCRDECRVGAVFPGFTLQHAQGCFQSSFEDTLMIHIATREANSTSSQSQAILSEAV